MEKFNKFSLPITILIASIILGGFYYLSQATKQNPVFKQQENKTEQEKSFINPAQNFTYDATLEIEKCKTELSFSPSGEELEKIVDIVNKEYQPKFEEEKKNASKALNILFDCLASERGKSDEGRTFCQIPTEDSNKRWAQLENDQKEMLNVLIDGQKQIRYKKCLDAIK